MCEEHFDKKTDGNIIYQETMTKSWYLKLELLSIEAVFNLIWPGLVFVPIIFFVFYITNALTFAGTLFGCTVIILICWFVSLLRFLHYYSISDRFLIKYSIIDDRIIILNVSTGACIFNFHLSEISCIEAPYYKARCLWGKYVLRDFFTSYKRCLLISSPLEEYKQHIPKHKQRIPVGYSKEMMLKLKELFFLYDVQS